LGICHFTRYNIFVPDAVIYTRVSKLKPGQGGKSISTKDQEKECRATAERNGWSVRGVFCDDGISASRYGAERPAWEALKAESQAGDILVIWEASRSSRDLEEYVELRRLCVERDMRLSYSGRILDLSRGDDRFSSGLDILVAERESELIKERTLRGKRSAAEAGRPSGKPPWGYRQKVDEGTGVPIPCAWEPDPIEAPRVKEVARRFLDGQGQIAITDWLQSTEGWHPSSRRAWHRALQNPALAGLRVHRGEVVGEGTWPPILTPEQHYEIVNRAAAVKRAFGHHGWAGPEPKYLLSGIALCGKPGCGLPLNHKAGKNRSTNGRIDTYGCHRGHVTINASDLDRLVEDEILEKAARVKPARFQTEDPNVQKAIDEIAAIERELDSWLSKAKRREVSAEAFAAVEKQLRHDIMVLRPQTVAKVRANSVDYGKLQQRWLSGTMREKRELVRLLVRVTVHSTSSNKPSECVNGCGETDLYARGLCHPCYHKAWRGAIPMPPKVRGVARVVIDPI
jgi:DNA invertase Pin-like site-specific DNA recombinase